MTTDINRLFVPYELALKLKEKGFDEPCLAWTLPNQPDFIISPCEKYGDRFDKMIQIPLYQQAIDFFRNKNIYITELPSTLNRWGVSTLEKTENKKGNFKFLGGFELNKAIEEAIKLI